MKIPKFKIKKIKTFLKKLPKTLGERAFLVSLGLLLLALIFGGLIFYKYSIQAEKVLPQDLAGDEKPREFKEKTYQKVLEFWQEREERFKAADFKKYPDPFREIKKELPTPAPEGVQETLKIDSSYIISRGETLWELAERHLGSGRRWREIKTEAGQVFTKNSAEVIPIGQKLIIPSE